MDERILAELNPKQREAVTHTGGPLLVIAGPGSGKTRIIVHRAAYFVLEKGVEPEHVLAITFTNRAAEEMRSRLTVLLGEQADGMWIYTFHAAALRLLRRFGSAIELADDFAVADEDVQRFLLLEAMRSLDLSVETHPPHLIADFISRRKAHLLDPTLPLEGEPVPAAWLEVARAYQDQLEAQRLLDFDDIIVRAVHLLRARPDVREHVQRALTHILVDEYQDINLAQFTFLTLLAPPDAEVTAVADEDQSIYGWRGADPHLVDRFRRHYRPRVVKLVQSYRSTGHILYAAQRFVARRRLREEQSFLKTERDEGEPIYHLVFQTLEQEQKWLAGLVRKATAEWGYRYRDIAILYRVHTLADAAEQHLLQQGIPVQRVQPREPFQHDALDDIIRYLALLHAPTEYDYVQALNFPTTLMDEPTQALAAKIARDRGVTLGTIAREPEAFPELGPLTRWQLRRFGDSLAALRAESATLPLDILVARLFELLRQRRSPFTAEEDTLVRGFQLAISCREQVQVLKSAVAAGRPIRLQVSPDAAQPVDAWAAYHILRHVLGDILNHPLATEQDRGAFLLQIGGGEGDLVLKPLDVGTLVYPLSVVAWRVGTDLLLALEPAGRDTYVVYDLETTGIQVRRDDILEIAAQRYRGEQPLGEPFRTLVRPQAREFIPKAASRVHGITWDDVAEAPTLPEVLPAFLDYIGEDVLVGHNIRRFDNRFLDRALGEHLGRGLANPVVDTLEMARRLFPTLRRYTLEYVRAFLELGTGQTHRAADDVAQTAALYQALLRENRALRARTLVPELLPLVALGILAAASPLVDEHRALVHAAHRVMTRFPRQPLLDDVVASLDEEGQWLALSLLARLRDMSVPADADDEQWNRWRDELMAWVRRYLQSGGEPTLAGFLDYQALRTRMDAYDPEADAVVLMTLHNAKGTEFPIVVILGLEEGYLPLWTTRDDERAQSEERRVLYVGMTRARDRLYLVSTLDRHDGMRRTASPYAFELDSSHVRRFQFDRRGKVKETR